MTPRLCDATCPWKTSRRAQRARSSAWRAARENYKLHCHPIDRPIQTANTLIGNPSRFIDDAVRFRQFGCPAGGGLIENEVSRAQDPVLQDIEMERE